MILLGFPSTWFVGWLLPYQPPPPLPLEHPCNAKEGVGLWAYVVRSRLTSYVRYQQFDFWSCGLFFFSRCSKKVPTKFWKLEFRFDLVSLNCGLCPQGRITSLGVQRYFFLSTVVSWFIKCL